MSHPLDTLLCDLRELTKALRKYVAAVAGGRGEEPLRAEATSTAQRQVDTQPSGQLLSANPQRAGLLLHNGTDGTLLIAVGEDTDASLDTYAYSVGPGETWDTRTVPFDKNIKQALKYAWVTEPPADYPSGVFLVATGGALKVTELAYPYK